MQSMSLALFLLDGRKMCLPDSIIADVYSEK